MPRQEGSGAARTNAIASSAFQLLVGSPSPARPGVETVSSRETRYPACSVSRAIRVKRIENALPARGANNHIESSSPTTRAHIGHCTPRPRHAATPLAPLPPAAQRFHAAPEVAEREKKKLLTRKTGTPISLPLPILSWSSRVHTPLPRDRVQAEATVGHTSVAGGSLP